MQRYGQDGKYYFMFRVTLDNQDTPAEQVKQEPELQKLYDKYGERLLQSRHPVLKAYLMRGLESALSVREQILANRGEIGSNERLEQSLCANELEIGDIQKALAMFNEEV